MHQSIATIDSPEFINLQPLDINPLMSRCEIKVLYLGENRNHSYITKEVASDMAKTLRGAPIVGYYKKEKEDFSDHGERVIFDDEGVKFECLTKPYGFVAPDSKVWFQKFEDTDDFGNTITREYLMATGYLWTGQYEECKSVIENGKNQSMELDEETLDGNWSTNSKTGMDFFIINDAIFSKLCILGDDVEPCFEGARVTAPDVSTSFTKVDDTFKKTLYTMMQELKFALEGGQSNMDLENKETDVTTEVVDTQDVTGTQETVVEENDKNEQTVSIENQDSIEVQSGEGSFVKKDDDEEKDSNDTEESNNDESNSNDNNDNSDDDEEEKDKKYSLLEAEYNDLKDKYTSLETQYQSLVEFKNQIESEKKDELINRFYMLTDEDKADVVSNKDKYSLDEIEAKLSVICVRKKVNFDLDEDTSKDKNNVEDTIATYTLESEESSTPAWISALKKTQSNRKEN